MWSITAVLAYKRYARSRETQVRHSPPYSDEWNRTDEDR